jgi:membrane associated rhomboid family serine protease
MAAARAERPCPGCGRSLDRASGGPESPWACGGCGSRAYDFGALRKAFPPEFFNRVLEVAREGGWRGHRRCPLCAVHMVQRRVELRGSTWHLDQCDGCRLLWFDREEHEAALGRIPAPPPPDPVLDAPPSTRRWARGGDAQGEEQFQAALPEGGVASVLAVLGLPIPRDMESPARPWATWSLVAAMSVATVLALALGGESFAEDWGFVPSLPFRHGGLDFLTSSLLHAGVWHLAMNAYFLLAFGPAVEGLLRPRRFLLVAGLAALAGDLLYMVLAGDRTVPSVGASGAVSGLLAYGAFALPRARVTWTWLFWFRPYTFTFPARAAFWVWFSGQVLGSLGQWMEATGVNHVAHVGGAAAGWALFHFGPDGPRPARTGTDTIRLRTPLRWEE